MEKPLAGWSLGARRVKSFSCLKMIINVQFLYIFTCTQLNPKQAGLLQISMTREGHILPPTLCHFFLDGSIDVKSKSSISSYA